MLNQKPIDITLYRGFQPRNEHVWSPFVVKLEARLRFAGIKYDLAAGSPKSAPKGKIPYIECNDLSTVCPSPSSSPTPPQDGPARTHLSDSSLIISTLTKWGVLPDLLLPSQHPSPSSSHGLSPAQLRAHDTALRALLEDKLYFVQGFEKWSVDDNFYAMRDHVMWAIPWPLRVAVGWLARRGNMATFWGQGAGRHSAEERRAIITDVWGAVAGLLEEAKQKQKGRGERQVDDDAAAAAAGEPFWVLGGDQPTEADCSLFGFVVSVLVCEAGPEARKIMKSFPVVVEYAERIHDRYFPDYEKWT